MPAEISGRALEGLLARRTAVTAGKAHAIEALWEPTRGKEPRRPTG